MKKFNIMSGSILITDPFHNKNDEMVEIGLNLILYNVKNGSWNGNVIKNNNVSVLFALHDDYSQYVYGDIDEYFDEVDVEFERVGIFDLDFYGDQTNINRTVKKECECGEICEGTWLCNCNKLVNKKKHFGVLPYGIVSRCDDVGIYGHSVYILKDGNDIVGIKIDLASDDSDDESDDDSEVAYFKNT
jgi:hypothetical protein